MKDCMKAIISLSRVIKQDNHKNPLQWPDMECLVNAIETLAIHAQAEIKVTK